MRRGITGRYETTCIGGEHAGAFIPHPLPPEPPLDLSNARQRLLERATLSLGRLDSITLLLPDPNLFLYAYVRREAVHLKIVDHLIVSTDKVFSFRKKGLL